MFVVEATAYLTLERPALDLVRSMFGGVTAPPASA